MYPDSIEKEISSPRLDISPNAPKIVLIQIKPDQIGMVIGGGGKTIKDIKERTGVEITIEDDGAVYLTGASDGVIFVAPPPIVPTQTFPLLSSQIVSTKSEPSP